MRSSAKLALAVAIGAAVTAATLARSPARGCPRRDAYVDSTDVGQPRGGGRNAVPRESSVPPISTESLQRFVGRSIDDAIEEIERNGDSSPILMVDQSKPNWAYINKTIDALYIIVRRKETVVAIAHGDPKKLVKRMVKA